MSTHSERSGLKENVLASRLEGVVDWVVKNKIPMLTGLGILVGGLLIGSVFMIREKERREMNWMRLSQAQALLAEKRTDAADTIIKEITTTAPGTSAASHALYYQSLSYIDQKKFDEAIRGLSDLVAQLTKDPLRPLALANLGFAYEQKGDYTQAAQTYQKFMDQYAEHFLAARMQLSLGQAQARAGDKEGAKKSLGQLVDLYPTSEWAKKARKILDNLQTR